MDEIPLTELWRDPTDFDLAVGATPRVDRYCSSSAWVLPAHAAFHADHAPLVLRSRAGWAALCAGTAPSIGRYLAPLESMWGLASPFLGGDSHRLALDVHRALYRRRGSWDSLWLSGLHRDGAMLRTLAGVFATTCSVRWGPVARRYAATLEGGFDGWLGRRSAKFRANLRRAMRRAEREGVTYEVVGAERRDDADALYRRILKVEATSWKGIAEVGITTGSMKTFYARTLELLVPRGALRVVFARLGGEDIGYVFGGVFRGTYRGLQVSFDDRYRALSLGNVLQGKMISHLAAEGVTSYDLGSEIEYKARWSEPGLTTIALVILRR